MKNQRGFTLIELIIVIVILGILAVTVAPQFFNFGADAREATLRGLQSSFNASASLVHARATIAGKENEADTEIELNGVSVPIAYGYPNFTAASSENDGEEAVFAVLNINGDDWNYSYNVGGELRLSPAGQNGTVTATDLTSIRECYLSYSPASSEGGRPTLKVETEGC